jgi:cytochrome c
VGRQDQRRIVTAALAGFALLIAGSAISSSSQAADQMGGKALFEKRCGGCHSLDKDKEGPRLAGVYGRKAGTIDSFQYSEALKNSKIVWSDDTLERWLTDTERVVPNNDMSFHVESAEERKAIIAYLKMGPSR